MHAIPRQKESEAARRIRVAFWKKKTLRAAWPDQHTTREIIGKAENNEQVVVLRKNTKLMYDPFPTPFRKSQPSVL